MEKSGSLRSFWSSVKFGELTIKITFDLAINDEDSSIDGVFQTSMEFGEVGVKCSS
jgi:hypothetical protein